MKDSEIRARMEARDVLFNSRIDALRLELASHIDRGKLIAEANQNAISKAEAATNKRFESVNEFRKTLGDQAAHFATRETVDLLARQNRERIDTLTENNRKIIDEGLERQRVQMADLQAQSSRLLIALMSTIIGTLIGALVVIWVNHI